MKHRTKLQKKTKNIPMTKGRLNAFLRDFKELIERYSIIIDICQMCETPHAVDFTKRFQKHPEMIEAYIEHLRTTAKTGRI